MTALPEGHPLRGRLVVDAATDPAGWIANRPYTIGASDAAKYSKVESIESVYVKNKLTEAGKAFGGSDFTRNGHAHEPGLMAWAGLIHNTATYRHESVPEFTATPDGLSVTPTGFLVLGEAKIKHHIIKGPTPGEVRQVRWAQYVCDAVMTKWVWQVLDPTTHRPYGDPHMVRIERDDAELAPVLHIAHQVRAAMLAAREFERNIP